MAAQEPVFFQQKVQFGQTKSFNGYSLKLTEPSQSKNAVNKTQSKAKGLITRALNSCLNQGGNKRRSSMMEYKLEHGSVDRPLNQTVENNLV
jgi:hypothetical protein